MKIAALFPNAVLVGIVSAVINPPQGKIFNHVLQIWFENQVLYKSSLFYIYLIKNILRISKQFLTFLVLQIFKNMVFFLTIIMQSRIHHNPIMLLPQVARLLVSLQMITITFPQILYPSLTYWKIKV